MSRTSLAVLLLAVLVAVAVPAAAHTVSPAVAHPVSPAAAPTGSPAVAEPFVAATLHEAIAAAPMGPSAPWAALALLATIALTAVSRRRHAVALTLILVVALLAFESGVHSTHHLGRADEASHCVVAWMSSQLSAGLSADLVHTPVAPAPASPAPSLAPPVVAARSVAPDAGRAPPAPAA